MVFITFLNILNALGGFPKSVGYSPYSDSDLLIRTFALCGMLAIPFYVGYLVVPYFFAPTHKKGINILLILFCIIFPFAMSFMDDGFGPGFLSQTVFLFAFLNLFLVVGAGFRSLNEHLKKNVTGL